LGIESAIRSTNGDENVYIGYDVARNAIAADANVIIGSSNSASLISSHSNISIGFRGEAGGGCAIAIGAEAKATAANSHTYGCLSSNTG
jgi:hypothetical protein